MPHNISKPSTGTPDCSAPFELVVIGLSSGGVELLMRFVPDLPAHFPVPVVICLHASASTTAALCELLGERAALQVLEAEDKGHLRAGAVYLAPGGYHLHVERDGSCSLSLDAPEKYARPSIDVLFESAAHAFRERLIAVVLTGANDDGAEGAKRVKALGGCVIVQDPADAQAPQMPLAALANVNADHIIGAREVGPLLVQLCSQGGRDD